MCTPHRDTQICTEKELSIYVQSLLDNLLCAGHIDR